MYNSLKDFVSLLYNRKELIVVDYYVDTELEMAEIVDRVSKSEINKAILFKNTNTKFPVLINALGSNKRMAYALGVDDLEEITDIVGPLVEKLSNTKMSLWEKLNLLPSIKQASYHLPKHVKTKKAPCQEVIMSKPDLNLLPILKFWPHEKNKIISLPLVHTKSLSTGARNLGLYPMQVYNENTTSIHWPIHKTGAKHFEEYKKAGKIMPVAIALGGDPIYTWVASAPLPDNLDEYILAGLVRRKHVRLVSCLTQDIEVPEDADFIIEGFIDPTETFEKEGPIGYNTGFYYLDEFYPKLHITCITHRKDAIYPTSLMGIPINENTFLSRTTEKIFLAPLRVFTAPEIKDLYVPGKGANSIAVVSIKKEYPGQAIKVAHSLWGAEQMMLFKLIIVVDEMNIRDIDDVFKVMYNNWNPDTDTIISRGPIDIHDHSTKYAGYGGKMCIDATVKMPEEESVTKTTMDERLIKFYHINDTPPSAKINIMFNPEVDINDFDTCIWLAISNIDIIRDCKFENNSVYIDATVKTDQSVHHRIWPNILCMDNQTIDKIDSIWDKLNINSPLVESPSLEYKNLLKGEGAKYKIN